MAHHETILNALSDAGVEFIVGGGMACILHGVERLTMDVDDARKELGAACRGDRKFGVDSAGSSESPLFD